MHVNIAGYGGCRSADFEINRIALLVGTGGQGKTSVLRGLAAALTGTVVPSGMTRATLGGLVNDRADRAEISLNGDGLNGENWSVDLSYPDGRYKTSGRPPVISPIAAGMIDPSRLPAKDLMALLLPLTGAVATLRDLVDALADAPLVRKGVATEQEARTCRELGLDPLNHQQVAACRKAWAVWPKIMDNGWETSWQAAKEEGRDLKAAWKAVTSDVWGSNKGPGWVPAGWNEALSAPGSLARASAREKAARTARDKAIGKAAVSADERERSRQLAEEDDEDARAASEACAEATGILDQARKSLDALPPLPVATVQQPCPCCGAAVNIVAAPVPGGHQFSLTAGAARHVTDVTAKELASARSVRQKAEAQVRQAEKAENAARQAFHDLMKRNERRAAAREIVSHVDEGAAAAVEAATAELAAAVKDQIAIEKWMQAASVHAEIMENAALVAALAPDGVRHRALVRGLEKVNDLLASLSKAAGWDMVSLSPDMTISCGGRSTLLADSEAYRLRTVLQVAIASLDGSSVVLVDDACRLPAELRGGLIRLLVSSGLQAVVGLMSGRPDKAPDLSRAGLGVTCWVADGSCLPIGGNCHSQKELDHE